MDLKINFTFSEPERLILGLDQEEAYGEDDVVPILFDIAQRKLACSDEINDLIAESEDGFRSLVGGESRFNELHKIGYELSRLERGMRLLSNLALIPRDNPAQ